MITSSTSAGIDVGALDQRLQRLGGQVDRVPVLQSLPLRLPSGVRTASTMTAVGMTDLLVLSGSATAGRLTLGQVCAPSRPKSNPARRRDWRVRAHVQGWRRWRHAMPIEEIDRRRRRARPRRSGSWRRSRAIRDLVALRAMRRRAPGRVGRVDVRGVRRPRRPGRRRPAGATASEPGDRIAADDAQPPRVPLARPRRAVPAGHAGQHLQLVVARGDRIPGRPRRGRARRSSRTQGFLERFLEGARRAARCSSTSSCIDPPDGDCPTACTRPTSCSTAARRPGRARPRRPSPTTWPRSSTPRARPGRPRA